MIHLVDLVHLLGILKQVISLMQIIYMFYWQVKGDMKIVKEYNWMLNIPRGNLHYITEHNDCYIQMNMHKILHRE